MRSIRVLAVMTILLVAFAPGGAQARKRHKSLLVTGSTTAANTGSDGAPLLQDTSADGRYVLFVSDASDLVDPFTDVNAAALDLFLWDKETKQSRLVSHAPGLPSTGGNAGTAGGSISDNGRYVVFVSVATNLVTGFVDNNASGFDVYLWDRVADVTTLVSHESASATGGGNGAPSQVKISDDGDTIAYESTSTNLVAGFVDNNGTDADIFVYDRISSTTALVSRSTASAAEGSNDESAGPVLSGDGTEVGYRSRASDLVAGFTGPAPFDAFLYHVDTGMNELLSASTTAPLTGGDDTSIVKDISTDGSRILIGSAASDLLTGFSDTNGASASDSYIVDTEADSITLVTRHEHSPVDGAADNIVNSSMDDAGRRVAFESNGATFLGPDVAFEDNNGLLTDIFMFDTVTAKTRLVSHAAGLPAAGGNAESQDAVMTDDGSSVVFDSDAIDLVTGFLGTSGNAFRYVVGTKAVKLMSPTASNTKEGAGAVGTVRLNASGSRVAFLSAAPDVVSGFTDGNAADHDIYLRT